MTDEYTKKKHSLENLPTFKKEMKDKYDQAFLGILQNETRIEPFIDAVFSFLYRKTDFYRTLTEESQVGFPPGTAENMLRCYFMKYNMQTKEAEAKLRDEPKIQEIIERPAIQAPPKQKIEKPIPQNQEEWQDEPDSHNGAVRGKYSWNQNFEDIDVVIKTDLKSAKEIKVDSRKNYLKVSIGKEVIIDDSLQHAVKSDDTTWSLEKGKNITINLTKFKEVWWSKLLNNEEEIDMKKIKPERGMDSMPLDEKAVIDKLQFDEMQKQLGRPQSHEIKVHDMLKKGWEAEGSPFKGQEFDPGMFNVDPASVQF